MLGLDSSELATLPVLVRELGLFRTLIVGARLQAAVGRGEPFEDLPPATDERERLSREQIGPAIILYRLLLEKRSQEDAYAITKKAVIEGAVAFLKESIGPLEQETLERLDDQERRAFVEERGEKFFNATVEWETIEPQRVEFEVTHCRFPALCAEVGHPELAPVFCAGDAKFFGTIEPNVRLDRPATIAGGDPHCLFKLSWIDDAEPTD